MSTRDVFWLCVGLLAAGAMAFVLPPLLRALPAERGKAARFGALVAFSSIFLVVSIGLYQLLGEPRAVDRSATGAPHATAMRDTAATAASLDSATTRLAARLSSGGGSDADWELLAQSHEYLGDATAAAAARAHRSTQQPTTTPPKAVAASSDVDRYRKRVSSDPRDGAAWAALAQLERSARNFVAAISAFDHAIELKAMSADDWADYADVRGTLDGNLSGAAAAIDKALALDARHTKALWLKGSLALEQRRYPDALVQWQRLRAVVADSSPDARIIDANIEEARSLAQGKSVIADAAPAQGAAIRGTVDIEPALKSRMIAGMTLFVFAKSVDSPGAPLAVLRTRPASWPVTFLLDDSLAMLPSRRLSGFDKVIVEARLSKSGQAAAQAGDLQAASDVVSARAAPRLALKISKVIS